MNRSTEALLLDALQLQTAERAELAAELIASLDGPADSDVAAAWAAELERRVAALDAGALKLEPWEDVKRRISREAVRK